MLSLDATASLLSLSQTSSAIWFGNRYPVPVRTNMADCWLGNEYSVRLIITKVEHMVTHWNAILFHLVYGSTIYRPACVFPCVKLRWNYNTVEFANEAYQFQYTLWENYDLTLQPVITYVNLCERISASWLSYFSNRPSVMEQNLNWNVIQALERPFTIGILSYTGSWCLVPFSSNVSCDRTHNKVFLCFD
jgi:hypothetical protein